MKDKLLWLAEHPEEARRMGEAGRERAERVFSRGSFLKNYQDVFAQLGFGRLMFNSITIVGSIVIGGLLVNSLIAYALVRNRVRHRSRATVENDEHRRKRERHGGNRHQSPRPAKS